MNTDDLEQWLPRHPRRPVPGEWREDILAAARSAAARAACGAGVPPALDPGVRPAPVPRPTGPAAPWLGWLRDWLWPHPVAWGALAAGWVLIVVFNAIADQTANEEQQSTYEEMLTAFAATRLRLVVGRGGRGALRSLVRRARAGEPGFLAQEIDRRRGAFRANGC